MAAPNFVTGHGPAAKSLLAALGVTDLATVTGVVLTVRPGDVVRATVTRLVTAEQAVALEGELVKLTLAGESVLVAEAAPDAPPLADLHAELSRDIRTLCAARDLVAAADRVVALGGRLGVLERRGES